MDQRRTDEPVFGLPPYSLTTPRVPLPRVPLVGHQKFAKIPRFNREIIITEKIDGTNGVVYVTERGVGTEQGMVYAGSCKRWLTLDDDNYGFAAWVQEHTSALRELGPGFHYGEWYGRGIQRDYGLDHRRLALFNVHRWADPNWRPACCDVVTVLARFGTPNQDAIEQCLAYLNTYGSATVPGFMNPEGIVIYHTAAKQLFKITLEGDEKPKSRQE